MLSAVNESQGYALGRGNDGSIYKYDAFGGVWVSDGNGGTVQIGDDGGYFILNKTSAILKPQKNINPNNQG